MNRFKLSIFHYLLICAFAFTASVCTHAQQLTAELTGQITDSSGAAVPGAVVTIANPARGTTVTVKTDARGTYIVPLLPPAEGYEISVTAPGFQADRRSGITLEVAQVARVNLALAVGSANQTVVVTGAPPLLDTQTSSMGQVISAHTITSLPLNGRSSFRLIELTPGVTFNQAAYGQFGDVAVNTTWDTSFSINGGQAQSNEILIDGVPSEVGFFNQITTIPSVDATQEFKVESGTLPAQYGRFSGGVINVSTKSGTNDLHGSIFEFLRNSALDANDYISNEHNSPKPAFKMNQYGVAVGGPVYLPKLYHGRNKTFFFFDYQGTRRIKGATFLTTVPTAAERTGDFSQLLNSKGAPVTIYNPFSTRVNPNEPNPTKSDYYIRDPFPNNQIPSGMMDPVAQKIIAYYPLPNTTGNATTNTNNYISNAPLKVDQDEGSIRIDQNVNDRYHLFGRFGWLLTDLAQPNTFGNVATGGAGAVGVTKFHNWSFALDNTVTLSPTLLLTVDYGYARWFQSRQTLSYGFDNSTLGFPSSFVSAITIPMFPSISATSYGAMNGQSYLLNGNDTHSLLTSVTKILGRHTLIAGTDLRLHMINFFNVGSSAGTFAFTNALTQGPYAEQTSTTAGNAMASLLLGTGASGSIPIGSGSELKDWYAAAYLQDNFQITNKLTLNIGLRYGEESPYTDRHDHLNYFSTTVASPARNPSFPDLTGGLQFAKVDNGSSSVYSWNTNQFEPRLGFSYTPMQSTVVRGGIGLNYAPLELANNAVGFVPTTGYSSSTAWESTTNGGVTPFNLLSNPYPQGLVQPAGSSQGASTSLGQGLSVWDAHPQTPHAYHWNFGIQRQLPSSVLVEASYVASRGMRLTHNFDMDTLDPKYYAMGSDLKTEVSNPFQPYVSVGTLSQPTVTKQQLLLPYPQFTGVSVENETWGASNYQSLQIKVNKRATHGISMLAAYTISKWMSNVTVADAPIGPTNNSGVQNWYDLGAEKSLSENDIPQSLILNFVADLPFGRGQRYLSNLHGPLQVLIGGWRATGILDQEKGFPLVMSATNTGGGTRPDLVGDPHLSSSRPKSQKVAEWFNTDAFAFPQPYQFGDVSRTIGYVRSPGLHNLDFSMSKETQVVDRLHMQFRAEAFNLTNTAHFSLPNTSKNAATFGQLNSLRASPPEREIQFAVKLLF